MESSSTAVRKSQPTGLHPTLGLFTTTMIVIGSMIGSGIFRKSGGMAADLGSVSMLLGVWALAGILTMFGALTNSEVAAAIPQTGGQYSFFDRIYGRFFGYLYGWSVFSVIQTGSIASIAYVFAEYFGRFVPLPTASPDVQAIALHLPFIGDILPFKKIGVKCVAVALILLLSGINYAGVRFGGAVTNIFTVSKVSAMAALVLMALLLPNVGSIENLSTAIPTVHLTGIAGVLAVASAIKGAFWAYDGWNSITFVSGEVHNPQRNIPRALIVGIGAVISVYMLVNLVYCYVLPIDVIAGKELVAANVADRMFTDGGRWIAVAVMISTLGTTNGTILSSARVYFSMAHRNVFPRFLGHAHPRFHTPSTSLVVQALWSCCLVFSGTFDTLTDTLIFVSWIFYGAAACSVIVLRFKEPALTRPYRVPLYPIIPIIFILFAAAYLGFTIYNDINDYNIGKTPIINCAFGAALVLIGVPMYWYYLKRMKKAGNLPQQNP